MQWITAITLDNYRAFDERSEVIKIQPCEHVLIFGENGSGKSSLYKSISDFLNSSVNERLPFELNIFKQSQQQEEGEILVEISETNAQGEWTAKGDYAFRNMNASTNREAFIRQASKNKGFLDYKKILDIHYSSTGKPTLNLFKRIVLDLLAEHLIPNENPQKVTSVELLSEWKEITKPLFSPLGRHVAVGKSKSRMPQLDQRIRALLEEVIPKANDLYGRYFDAKVSFTHILNPIEATSAPKWHPRMELFLNVQYAGLPISEVYPNFLNEARLSALSICIYLSSILKYPAVSQLKVLFLDDIFIGLDSSNRIPVLQISKDEFIPIGYQIFISSYDKEWYEMAKFWFNNENIPYKALEIYVNDKNDKAIFDSPVIIQNDVEEHDKAKKYFLAKDYPAAGNAIRKACEGKLKALLPKSYKTKADGTEIEKFEDLLQRFEKLYEDHKLTKPYEVLRAIKRNRKFIWNPASHFDAVSPLFRREIEDALNIMDKLLTIELSYSILLEAGSVLKVNFPDQNLFVMLTLAEPLKLLKSGGEFDCNEDFKAFCVHWKFRGKDFAYLNKGEMAILAEEKQIQSQSLPRKIGYWFKSFEKSANAPEVDDILANIKIPDGRSIRDLINS